MKKRWSNRLITKNTDHGPKFNGLHKKDELTSSMQTGGLFPVTSTGISSYLSKLIPEWLDVNSSLCKTQV